ncbi:MAG TPA: hypothetical protein DC049_09490 [Spirochaetia bacterium]|nr:hypothetical protein [Spirochaetia bacterium]
MQPYHNLPIEFADVKNGHAGTHAFLVNDFLRSVTGAKLPPTNVWLAARFNAPGLVAHESAQKGGVLMKIPDFGMPPVGSSFLEPEAALLP